MGPALLWMARDNAGLSQRELAARAGVTQSMIAAYEAGTRQATLPTLLALLRAAGQEVRLHLCPLDEQDLAQREQESLRTQADRGAWMSEQRRAAQVAQK